VPIHYDPLIGKLIVWGADRREAVARLRRALAEYRIEGIRTNIRFFAELAGDREFEEGRLSTAFIDEYFERRARRSEVPDELLHAAALAAAVAYRDRSRGAPELAGLQRRSWQEATRPAAWGHFRRWRGTW
jgi:acetyl-CoA carboxylase biotin carboxylase subunit